MFNSHGREETLRQVKEKKFDLLIVGGGITGAGVARDAASRGLSVLLVEGSDFASGTSSRSSKLVHGGIRYLENLEFGLVHEALTERRTLLNIAPHMVHPLRFMIPIYKKSRVGLLKMELGMILYDLLSFFEAPQLHEVKFQAATSFQEPLLKQDQLTGSVTYSDAFMEDDRLVIETLRSARHFGAECVNYVKANKVTDADDFCSVELQDELTQNKYVVQAKHVVGCVGPWTDIFGHQALPTWKDVLRPTKGVHLVFDRARVPVSQAIVMAVEERIVFVIPRDNVVIVGTTDTDFKKNPADVNTERADVDYLLSVTNQYFPQLKLTQKDVMSCYSGVRPLVQDSSSNESKTSREHQIFRHSPHVTLVAGGKYTTYRSMAEEIVEKVLKTFAFEERMSLKKPRTLEPLNPRVTQDKIDRLLLQAASLAEEYGVSEETFRYMVCRRGEEALQILQTLGSGEDEMERIWQAEARFSINHEMCLNLVDFYWRRSPLFLFQVDHGVRYLRSLASVFADKLGWSEAQKQEQLQQVLQQIAHDTQALR